MLGRPHAAASSAGSPRRGRGPWRRTKKAPRLDMGVQESMLWHEQEGSKEGLLYSDSENLEAPKEAASMKIKMPSVEVRKRLLILEDSDDDLAEAALPMHPMKGCVAEPTEKKEGQKVGEDGYR
ncbi:unnamed protein product [Linum trigynum]|uniref:Uncharacterized protein n=1 Tax=Linum trigynum TaxID=586398 RepID=A0AAV2DYF7_9ROSI